MKSIKLFVSFVFCSALAISFVFAKGIKPKLMVYGSDISAYAAAVQSARSGVPTLWILDSPDGFSSLVSPSLEQRRNVSLERKALYGGMWLEIVDGIIVDSTDSEFKVDFSKSAFVLESLARKEENLVIVERTKLNTLVKKKNGWSIELSNRERYDVRAIIDASMDLDFKKFVDNTFNPKPVYLKPLPQFSVGEIRTLATLVGDNGLTIQDVIDSQGDNLFMLSLLLNNLADFGNVEARINIGQVLGASAAYCAFFKTTADKIDVRKVQAELISYGDRVLPFVDIANSDPNYEALQRIFLVNVLPWNSDLQPLLFESLDSVSVISVKPVIQHLYSRAQLWFLDNQAAYFTTQDVIELLKVIAFRGNELDNEVAKSWKKRFKFNEEFNPLKPITRYQFAVLLDAYAAPFTKRVNIEGVIQR